MHFSVHQIRSKACAICRVDRRRPPFTNRGYLGLCTVSRNNAARASEACSPGYTTRNNGVSDYSFFRFLDIATNTDGLRTPSLAEYKWHRMGRTKVFVHRIFPESVLSICFDRDPRIRRTHLGVNIFSPARPVRIPWKEFLGTSGELCPCRSWSPNIHMGGPNFRASHEENTLRKANE